MPKPLVLSCANACGPRSCLPPTLTVFAALALASACGGTVANEESPDAGFTMHDDDPSSGDGDGPTPGNGDGPGDGDGDGPPAGDGDGVTNGESDDDGRPLGPAPDFGANVRIFDPSMGMDAIQAELDGIIGAQASNHFGEERYAYLFKPGSYDLDVSVGFYMHAAGLGKLPDDVQITGAVRSKADWFEGNATQNFWRTAENLSVAPTRDDGTNVWAVSQGTSFRRMHVKGPMNLWDNGWSSGGFIADSAFDGRVNTGSQQQFFTRSSALSGWEGGGWSMVFVGTEGAPSGDWPATQYTTIEAAPRIREKPYLTVDDEGHYFVRVPALREQSSSTSWRDGASHVRALSTDRFYVAHHDRDDATSINAALDAGKHLLLLPGVYRLDAPLHVSHEHTVVFGLGFPTLLAMAGNEAMRVDDLDGVIISGVLLDAGERESPTLLELGREGEHADHRDAPSSLHDLFCRVGGAAAGRTRSCVVIHSDDVIGDNLWLWRADHSYGVGWDENPAQSGLVVNGDRVTMYGLFAEHFEGYQTVWNGNDGRVYFYQSELPYDAPSQDRWQHDGVDGYASYKVADRVQTHEAWGLGVYAFFHNAVRNQRAIETPPGLSMHHMFTIWLGSADGSEITHIVNDTGEAVNGGRMQSKTDY